MPLALRWLGPSGGRVPILGERLEIGSAPASDVVVVDPRLLPRHARLSRVKGDWVVSAEAGAGLWVNGTRVPLFALRHGDVVDLCAPGSGPPHAFRLEDRLGGAFVPPGASRLAAWLSLPAGADPASGPGRYVGEEAEGCDGALRRGRDPAGGGAVALRVETLAGGAPEAEQRLAPLAAVAAAPHPGLAPLLDLGVTAVAAGPCLWSACAWIEGASCEELLAAGPLPWPAVVRLLAGPARGLAWLHRRGLLHRAVSPDHLLGTPQGQGRLAGWRRPALYRRGVPALGQTGPYLAPEESGTLGLAITPAVDVFALAAVALALLAGREPASPAGRERARPEALPGGLPEALEHLLHEGLAPLPAHRPNAADAARRLEALAAAVGWDVE